MKITSTETVIDLVKFPCTILQKDQLLFHFYFISDKPQVWLRFEFFLMSLCLKIKPLRMLIRCTLNLNLTGVFLITQNILKGTIIKQERIRAF